jgi:hypothetical protein
VAADLCLVVHREERHYTGASLIFRQQLCGMSSGRVQTKSFYSFRRNPIIHEN